jgi:SAM-dependent methyltransferase
VPEVSDLDITENRRVIYETGEYLANHPTWHAEDSQWKALQIYQLLDDNSVHPTSVGEVGCGAGEVLYCLSHRLDSARQFVGYDISADAIRLAKAREGGILTFNHADFLAMDQESFDLVLAIDVFEHVEDYMNFLRKLRSRGTNFVFHIPLDLSAFSIFKPDLLLYMRRVAGHLHFFTREIALAALADAGYQVVSHRYTRGGIEAPSPDRRIKARVLKKGRRAIFALSPDWAARILGGLSLLVLAR